MGKTEFTEAEKSLVEYFKQQLVARGIQKFPRDWHLKQLTVARNMLAGEKAPSVEEWKACIDWCFAHEFWGDKVDHLARVETLWVQYVLSKSGRKNKKSPGTDKEKELLNRLYYS